MPSLAFSHQLLADIDSAHLELSYRVRPYLSVSLPSTMTV
jgi:hypothetical protein